jgi:hypothetical protein
LFMDALKNFPSYIIFFHHIWCNFSETKITHLLWSDIQNFILFIKNFITLIHLTNKTYKSH